MKHAANIQKAFESLDRQAWEAIHEKLTPPLSEDEKSMIVDFLVHESQGPETKQLQFLEFLYDYEISKYFKWRGVYGPQHGDRLLARVLELCSSQSAHVRENTTHVLRDFGRSLGIAISPGHLDRIAESLILLARDESISVARWALTAIGDQARNIPAKYHQEIRSIIEQSISASNSEIRAAATWALGHLSPLYSTEKSKLIQMILGQLNDKNGAVIENAIIALDWIQLSAREAIGEAEEDIYRRLTELAKVSNGHRFELIGSVLEKIGRPLPPPFDKKYEAQKRERLRLERRLQRSRTQDRE